MTPAIPETPTPCMACGRTVAYRFKVQRISGSHRFDCELGRLLGRKECVEPSPWLAYTRTGPSHKSFKTSVDHGTIDGRKTLCGAEVAGGTKSEPFNRHGAFACKRCVAALSRAEGAKP